MNKIVTFLTIALFAIPTYLMAAQSQNLESILLEAASGGNTDMVRSFLDNGANVEVKNDAGATPLIFASAKGQKEVVALLLDRGANVNAKTTTGITPLMGAAAGGFPEIVKLLLANGADVSAKDQQGRTAFRLAEAAGESQVTDLLKSAALEQTRVASQRQKLYPAKDRAPAVVPVVRPTSSAHTETIGKADSQSGLTVRSEPSPQGKVMAYLPIGSKVSYSGEASNGWVKLSGPIADGWIAERYLASGSSEASVIRVDNPDQCLRVRGGPGGNYDKIGCLPMGAKVKMAGPAQNNWAKITSPMEGWVSAGQIQGPGVFPATPATSGAQQAKSESPRGRTYKRKKTDEDLDFSQTDRQQASAPAQPMTGPVPFGPGGIAGPGGRLGVGPMPFGMGFR